MFDLYVQTMNVSESKDKDEEMNKLTKLRNDLQTTIDGMMQGNIDHNKKIQNAKPNEIQFQNKKKPVNYQNFSTKMNNAKAHMKFNTIENQDQEEASSRNPVAYG